mmetsp:Transcript_3867/g.11177  ORF Transcript_3867/g.11177 Transcript_3867/m.11177 type:complete len:475 (+) Transcript_3867:428-1852(+)
MEVDTTSLIQLKEKKDYSAEVESRLPGAQALAEGGQLREAIDGLMGLEKACRLGNDNISLKKLVLAMVKMCHAAGDWDMVNTTLLTISKRRSQSKVAIIAMTNEAMTYLDEPGLARTEVQKLLETLREVTDGRIFVEAERAKLTKRLADIKEEDGLVDEACDILQEVHVETYGALTKKEKAEFILEQIRLSLKKRDFVRALINSRKVNKKVLEEDGMDDLKLKYYLLMITYFQREANAWELCQCYHAILKTPKVRADEEAWQAALGATVLFRALSKYDNETSDFLFRLKEEEKDRLGQLPAFEELATALTTDEIVGYPMAAQAAYESHFSVNLAASPDGGPALMPPLLPGLENTFKAAEYWASLLHKRVTQHNIRVVAKYYRCIRIARLAQLLALDVAGSERAIAELVEEGDLWARIDRPAGIVKFRKTEDLSPDAVLGEWNSDISQLLGLVQETTHLIQKENMLNKVEGVANA